MIIFYIVLVNLVLFSGICFYCLLPARCPKKAREKIKATLFAHRGLHKNGEGVPENSVAAMLAAKERGYGAELDVNLSCDGSVVVFHDDRLNRMTDGDGIVWETPYAELSALRLVGTEERVPLFSALLDAVYDMPLIVEIKFCPNYEELCEKTYAILRSYKGWYCIESFDLRILEWFRFNAPEIIRGQLVSKTKKGPRFGALQAFLYSNLFYNFLTRPHFIACEYKYYSRKWQRVFCRLTGAAAVSWTCRDKNDHGLCTAKFDSVIFEHYEP